MIIVLDRPAIHIDTKRVWWIGPNTKLEGRLFLFGIPIPFTKRWKTGKDLRVGDQLDTATILAIEYE